MTANLRERLARRLGQSLNLIKNLKIKGSMRTPCFCLGTISIILFISVSLGAGLILKSLDKKGDITLSYLQNKGSEEKSLFIESANKAFQEAPEMIFVENSSIKPVSPPSTFSPQVLGALVSGYEPEDAKKVITEYIVEEGDTLSSVAEKFNISLNTLLWANDLSKSSLLKNGQKLIVLPVSGLVYHVKKGDVLSDVASKYKATTSEIIAINDLGSEGNIYVGDILVLPNAKMPVSVPAYTAPILTPLANSYFICPISAPCRVTQGLHWYNAIDFSHSKCGEPIFAAAEGEVVKVKLTSSTSRWAFGGAGNTISILHPNGVVTSYGHIAVSLVDSGEKVSQGQIIALMGGQPGMAGAGLSTGCHLHFGVSGARNPFSR